MDGPWQRCCDASYTAPVGSLGHVSGNRVPTASAHALGKSALFASLATTAPAARGWIAADVVVRRMRKHSTRAD